MKEFALKSEYKDAIFERVAWGEGLKRVYSSYNSNIV